MKKRALKATVLAMSILLVGSLAGCGTNTDKNKSENDLAGNIQISGSTAIQPLIEKSSKDYNSKYPNVSITVQGGGSGTGLTQVSQKTVNIGNSDVLAEEKLDKEAASKLVDHKVCAQGFALVTSKDVKVKSLSKKDIADIFSGAKTNWKDFGGEDLAITVIHRPASSGTRGTFVSTVLDKNKSLENDSIGIVQDSNGNVKTALSNTKGAISYLGLGYLNEESVKEAVNVISIDGVEPNKENITNGKYIFWSWGHMYTNGEADKESQSFIEYVMSKENKENVESLGFISSSDMKVK